MKSSLFLENLRIHSRVTITTKNKAFFGIVLKENYKTYNSNFSYLLIHVNILTNFYRNIFISKFQEIS